MGRFFHRHKVCWKVAGLGVAIICSSGVLFAVYRHYHPPQPQMQEAAGIEAGGAANGHWPDGQGSIRGSEVKEKLASLRKDGSYAIIVATKELLLDRKTSEPVYLVYPLDDKKHPRYVSAEDGTPYLLAGINYGCVLKDMVLRNTGLGSDSYYTIAGFMEEAEYAERNNYVEGISRKVVVKDAFHPYKPEQSLPISDDDCFYQGFLYDKNEQEIGCIYYSSLN